MCSGCHGGGRGRRGGGCVDNIPIPTSFFSCTMPFPSIISECNQVTYKRDVGLGLFVQCFYALSLHLVSVVFGTAIPTSLYIFGLYLLVYCMHWGHFSIYVLCFFPKVIS